MRLRRFWHTLGVRGVLSLLAAAGVFSFSVYVWHQSRRLGISTTIPLAPALVAALALVPIIVTWGRYRRADRTADADEVLPPLLRSREEYCLILRPFGSDGEIVLRRGRGGFTLEQLIARAARRTLRFRAYAMVDQARRLAPPGLVFLRTPHSRWQQAVAALIRRAHSIVLVLPPGADIRQSFGWEIERITHLGVQSRVVVVLPPPDRDRDAHARARQQACVLLAVFEGFAGTLDDVDSLKAHHWDLTLPERAIVLKYERDHDGAAADVQCWAAPERMPARRRYRSYAAAIEAALAVARADLADLDFSARYR